MRSADRVGRVAGWLGLSLAVLLGAYSWRTVTAADPAGPKFRKHMINADSPFEAAGIFDINGDGKSDVFSGDSWYEAPAWKRHKVRDVEVRGTYREDFCDQPLDVNGDGRLDIVTCSYFTKKFAWVEHPSDPRSTWVEHLIDSPGSSEAARLIDLDGDGKPEFLPNTVNAVVWYELVAQTPQPKWVKHELRKAAAGHGVGTGDINGDGRPDIITPRGWCEQPGDLRRDDDWSFHAEFDPPLEAAGIEILGYDVDGDRLTDVVWGNGHGYGLYWLKQERTPAGGRRWVRRTIDAKLAQAHTLYRIDLDGDGQPELVTGKRVYAHEVEPGATDAPGIYVYRYDRRTAGWVKQVIDEGEPARNAPDDRAKRNAQVDFPRGTAGTGLEIAFGDIDGDGDIDLVCPGKSGLYLFENLAHSK